MDALPVTLEKWRPLKSLLAMNHKPTGQELSAPGKHSLHASAGKHTVGKDGAYPCILFPPVHFYFELFLSSDT